MRRKIFGENEYQKAVDSLKNRDDSVEFFKEMISFISENKQNPFFLYWATPIPHNPLQAPQKWINYYKEKFGEDILKLCVKHGGVLSGEHGIGIEKRGKIDDNRKSGLNWEALQDESKANIT